MENGTEIFQQMLLNNEMDKTGFIKTFLQLSDQDLLYHCVSFLEGINFEQAEEENINTEKSLAELMEDLSLLSQQCFPL